jgi:hypothetical protein
MEKKVLTEDMVTKIKEILSSNENKDSLFACFSKDSKKCLIYPTDDIHLSKEQFLALTIAINEKSYYVMQLEEINQIFNTGNCIFEISSYDDYECVYDEYEKNIEEFRANGHSDFNMYFFWSKSLMFSDSLDWILQITECLDGGIGILGGNPEKVNRFMEVYGRCEEEYSECIKNHKERNLPLVLNEIFNILS